jgi:hypothetical protein
MLSVVEENAFTPFVRPNKKIPILADRDPCGESPQKLDTKSIAATRTQVNALSVRRRCVRCGDNAHFALSVSGVDLRVPITSRCRFRVMVNAENVPVLFKWFAVWMDESGVLRCELE